MTNDLPDAPEASTPDSPSVSPVAEAHPADDISTAPTIVLPPPIPLRRSGPFKIYSPDDPELTDEMRLAIEIQMTAQYWLHKALEEESRVDMPADFRERKVVWKLVLHEMVVAVCLLLLGWLLLSGLLGGWIFWSVVIAMAVDLIVGYYAFKLWSITFVVSNRSKTGISRERVRWMLINEIRPELSTTAIILSQPFRNSLFSTLNIDWWRVRLDTAAQGESTNVQMLHFVRGGDRLVDAIAQFKLALR